MSPTSRRIVAGIVRLGLLVLGVCVVYLYFKGHFERRHSSHIQVQRTVPATLGPNDLRIYNVDSTVDLMLMGNSILAGLSPKMVAKVNSEMASSDSRDTSGLGASISQIVKKSVAGAIGTHAVFPGLGDSRHPLRGRPDRVPVEGRRQSRIVRFDDGQRRKGVEDLPCRRRPAIHRRGPRPATLRGLRLG